VSQRAESIRHPSLEAGAGAPCAEAHLTDRARLGVLLQAAGLLSLVEAAGWRLPRGFSGAKVDAGGRLLGVEAAAGRSTRPAQDLLVELAGELFRASGSEGRGEARRALRRLLAQWRGALAPVAADAAVEQILAAAPFLDSGEAREALDGVLAREGREIAWRPGRSSARRPNARACGAQLAARRRWAAAVRAFRAAPPADEPERQVYARALAADGRVEAALALIGDRRDLEAEQLRLEAQVALGEIAAARETARRIERLEPGVERRLEHGDALLRALALARDGEAARDWCARLLAEARGPQKGAARLFAALAALDRGDLDGCARQLANAAPAAADPELAPRWHEVQADLALERADGEALAEHARQRLLLARRTMTRFAAGRTWNLIGLGRQLGGDLGGAERALTHAARLLGRCDGPLAVTLAGSNLAEVRLRVGRLDGVEPLLAAATVENLRAGNRVAQIYDEALWARLELARGELDAALARCRRGLEAARRLGTGTPLPELAAVALRAAGWLERPEEAAAWLDRGGEAAVAALEAEERALALALAGRHEAARAAAAAGPLHRLEEPLVRGEAPHRSAWTDLDALVPFRRARFVLDAELVAPGSVPGERRAEAAALLRRLGAPALATRVTRGEDRAWRALSAYCERPPGDPRALAELLAAAGHPEAVLRLRDGRVEHRLVEGAAIRQPEELAVPCGAGELVLEAEEIDEPLRALVALLRRDLPGPAARAAPAAASPLAGASPALAAAVERLRRFAASELPVLILGENGTGKELAAHFVHEQSARRGRDLVPFNCAGLAESLQMSELFGHARGAFTGAERAHAGVFEQAQGTSLFLDEIGDLPASAQGAILRALQEREIRRLGESVPRRIDVRVIAATNRDLERMVADERFRQDLFFRLKVATVVLPPLRDRGDDVLLLAERFLEAERRKRPGLRLTPEARRALAAHPWPGNVRELRHALEAAALLADDGRIAPEHLELGPAPALERSGTAYHRSLEEARRKMIVEALEAAKGNRAAAARRLGMSRQNFSYLAKKLGLGGA